MLICNNIMLFGIAVPLIFYLPLLRIPMSMSVKGVLTIGFFVGLIIDIFSDTPGVNTISCTILGALRRPIFKLFTGNDEALGVASPTIVSVGFWIYFKYLLLCTIAYCFTAVSLEYFTFVSIERTLSIIGASSLLSFLIMLGIDSITGGKKR